MRWIFPRGLDSDCGDGGVEVLSGREVELAVVAEDDRAAVMLGVGVLGILVEHGLAAGNCSGERGVRREPRQTVSIRAAERVEDVVEVIGREGGIERDVVDPLLHARRADVGELQERGRVGLGVRRRQHLDRSGEFDDEHAAVGKELDVGGKRESGREDLVLEVVACSRRSPSTGADTATFPAVSRAIAVNVCAPLATVRVSQDNP